MTVRLVIFDVDGTILQIYSWQYIHENLGTWLQAQTYYNQFFANHITYEEWARLDAALWKGESLDKISRIISQMPYTQGVKETFAILKQNGIKTYLLSAGLTQVTQRVQKDMGADGYTANTLRVKNGILTGEVEVNVSFHNKDMHLPRILRKFNLAAKDCAAVGDDPTLIPLFKKVGLAVAFNPVNKAVEKDAHVITRKNDLLEIIPHVLKEL
jgi:phosphoserine phosphatase